MNNSNENHSNSVDEKLEFNTIVDPDSALSMIKYKPKDKELKILDEAIEYSSLPKYTTRQLS